MWENIAFAIVGIAILGLFVFVYGVPRKTDSGRWAKRSLSPTFARVYGLLSLAVLAVAAVKLTTSTEILTGMFTLLGTIAGYLAGSRVEAVPTPTKSDSAAGTETEKDPQVTLELS